jgi:hypothetical protein
MRSKDNMETMKVIYLCNEKIGPVLIYKDRFDSKKHKKYPLVKKAKKKAAKKK